MDKENHHLQVPSDTVEYEPQIVVSLIFSRHGRHADFRFHMCQWMFRGSTDAGPLFIAFVLFFG